MSIKMIMMESFLFSKLEFCKIVFKMIHKPSKIDDLCIINFILYLSDEDKGTITC